MNNKQTIALDGTGIELPKFIGRFSGGGSMSSNSIDEIMTIANKNNLQIESINPFKIDKNIFDNSVNLIDDTKSLLNAFYYALLAEDQYNVSYDEKFFTFFEIIKSIESKVRQMKELYQNNFDLIHLAEGNELTKTQSHN